jgi:hypothetical protein
VSAALAPTGDLASALHEVGYAVVPLLSSSEVACLRADFDASHPVAGTGFETDFERDDPAFKEGVVERTSWVWDRVGPFLPGYAPFMASYLVKWPTPDSDLPLHADWSYVDESLHPTFAVWVPLVDTGPGLDNGPLAVVPGSHRLVRSWRGTATPAWYESGRDGFLAAAVSVEVPAGSAVVFDNRLLHHSPPNQTPAARPVLAGAFAPVGAQFVHVIGDGGSRGRVLEVDATFFRDHNPSGLRAVRPEAPPAAPEVDLVEGAFDPVALAADHGFDDASPFAPGGGVRRRWPRPVGPVSIDGARAVLDAAADLSALPWAPATVDAHADAAIHLPLVVEGRATPWGAALLGELLERPTPWSELRVVRVRAGAEVAIAVGAGPGGTEVAAIGLAPGDASLLVVGRGWAELPAGGSAVVPERDIRVRNRSERDAALLIAERSPARGPLQRLRASAQRKGWTTPASWQLAVELTEAMA